jgi:uncharacterized membrane protein YcjF (UPF0283 family)
MDTNFIHADTFFFVSTILLTIFAVLFIIAIAYLISIMTEVRRVVRLVRGESEKLAADLDIVRERIRETGFAPQAMFSLASSAWKKRKKKRGK